MRKQGDGRSRAILYGPAQSHSVVTSRLMFAHAGVEYELRNIWPGPHKPTVRLLGFPRWTVPALRIDGRRVQGTLPIARELERLAPGAGLFPRDPGARRAVEAAERFGHDEFQYLTRRIFIWVQAHSNEARTWTAREVMRAPAPTVQAVALKPGMACSARFVYGARDDVVRADLARLPTLLDRADRLIDEGTIGGTSPNAADFQVFTSLRHLLLHVDLRPLLERRRCAQAALRLIPDYPQSGPEALSPIPAALPQGWLRGVDRTVPDRISARERVS